MEEVDIWYILVITGVFLSSCSQLLLKKSADKDNSDFFLSIFNWRVIIAYSIFFMCVLINITAMGNGVNLKDVPILEALGYVFVPILSLIFLNETITKQTFISIVLITFGIIIFYH